ncbi:LysM peptidoglycan-binding domain-containing protein [Marivirga tractuosa]|uniref:LysM peptidoglycan-binding domain-containing protein n=1 Tax=Marivirga tractuosa TaxID=1006 RepID=UPI0035D0C893
MKIKISFICLLVILITSINAKAIAVDSVGIKVIDGEKYIIHKLEPKETLYSLGKRYHVSVAEIQDVNPQEKDGYKIDQIGRELLIPYKEEEFTTSGGVSIPKSNAKQHTVEAGETIYSISKKYDISQNDIMKWNELQSTNLDIGQKLWVSKPTQSTSDEKQDNVNREANDKEQITHIVDMGETIYSISKKYDVTQSEIIELNDLKDNNIAVGQKLIIKADSSKKQKEEKPKSQYQTPSVQTFHNAKEGETYKKIANMYGLKEAKLKEWNKFKEPFFGGEVIKIVPPKIEEEKSADVDKKQNNESIEVDESRIHTVESGETLYSLSDKYGVEVEDLRKWNSLDNYQLSRGQKLYIKNPDALMADVKIEEEVEKPEFDNPKPKRSENPQKQDTKAYFTVEEDDMPKIDKIEEKGVAEVIEGSEGTEKYLALHRTAKIGTIMQVRNDLNDQIVFVRVLGKLPNTGVDEKVIIRISKKAFEKLGGVDYKFPVEISYLPLKD